MPNSVSKWLSVPERRPLASFQLICFHHAGGGASVFHPWSKRLRAEVELLAVQLPGRENRFSEPPLTTLDEILDQCLEAVIPALRPPYALLGHSFGGLLAYMAARRLTAAGVTKPERLVISASKLPRRISPEATVVKREVDDETLIDQLVQLGGIPREFLKDRELLKIFLPAIRADMAAMRGANIDEAAPLPIPITVFRGEDDKGFGDVDVEEWRRRTAFPIAEYVFPGGHFYFKHRLDDVIDRLNDLLGEHLRALSPDIR